MRYPALLIATLLAVPAAAFAQDSDLMVVEDVQAQANADTDVSFSITLTNLVGRWKSGAR